LSVRLALVIQRYFPHGGLQRDCRALLTELLARGHACRVYCRDWRGEPVAGAQLRRLPARGLGNHRRDADFARRVVADLAADTPAQRVDGVIGFNPMPGLDVYFAGDGSFIARHAASRPLYRLTPRYRARAALERAVFDPAAATQVLLLTAAQAEEYRRCHGTPPQRLHVLPAGLEPGRRPPRDERERARLRAALRSELGLARGELALLLVASSFATKGLDRAIAALAHLLAQQPEVAVRLLVAGPGNPHRYRRLARRLRVARRVQFLGARDDVPALMLAADLLLHPGREEAGGVVLLEAIAAGLPLVASGLCGYAAQVEEARAGIVLPRPFAQAQLDAALLRNLDGVFRAQRRECALRYAVGADLYRRHAVAANLVETLLRQRREARGG